MPPPLGALLPFSAPFTRVHGAPSGVSPLVTWIELSVRLPFEATSISLKGSVPLATLRMMIAGSWVPPWQLMTIVEVICGSAVGEPSYVLYWVVRSYAQALTTLMSVLCLGWAAPYVLAAVIAFTRPCGPLVDG